MSIVDNSLETIALHTSHFDNFRITLRKTKNSLNPVSTLHPELLARIFSLVIYNNDFFSSIDGFNSYPADSRHLGIHAKQASLRKTVSLSSVCGYWRHITLGISSLWTYIPIYLWDESVQGSLDSAPVWLDRARATPLDVSLDMRELDDPLISKAMLDGFLTLPLRSRNIRTLYLSLATTTCLNTLLKSCFSDGVPATLTKLHIIIRSSASESSMVQDWLSQCQELQVLQLSVDTLCHSYFPMLPNMVELELFSMLSIPLTTVQLVKVLHACPNLQRLMLNDVGLDNITETELTPIAFLHLKTLVLHYVDVAIVLPLLSSTSGSLSLTIVEDTLELSNNLINRLGAFSRSTTVTALHLEAGDFRCDINTLFRLFPHLLTLSLRGIHLDGFMTNALQGTSGLNVGTGTAPSAFPTLQAIWLAWSRLENEEALRTLVRLCSPKQLKLNHCLLASSGPIMKSKSLHEYLLNSILDLIIIE